MTRQWERELRALKDVPAPLERIRERAARGHDEGARMDLPPRRQRIAAGLVAFAVFAIAGAFAWRAFEVAPAPADDVPSNELPVLSVLFDGNVGPIDDGSDGNLRRVNTVIDYGEVHEESFTSTTPGGAHVDWVVVDNLTVFTPGPAAGSPVAMSADGEDPRVLIGSPQDWPNFERFDQIDRLPSAPGNYVLVLEADYPEGTARTARRVQIVEASALQLSPIEGGGLDAARATAYVDGSGVEGFLSTSTYMISDVGGQSVPRAPDFGTQEPLVVAEGAPLVLATPADAASAGLTERYALTPDRLPIDLAGQTSTLSSAPGIYLLAVDATWEHGKVGWGSDGTRETARFFFPIEVVPPLAASPSVEPGPDPSVLVATLDAPVDGTMPGLTLEAGGELEEFFAQGGKWSGVNGFLLPLLFFSPPLAPGATIRVEGNASEVDGELEVLDQDHRRTGEVLPLNLISGSGALPGRPAFYMLTLEGTWGRGTAAFFIVIQVGEPEVAEPSPLPATKPGIVPDLTGLGEGDAYKLLYNADLEGQSMYVPTPGVANGVVASSDPPAGTELDTGAVVTLIVSGTTAFAEGTVSALVCPDQDRIPFAHDKTIVLQPAPPSYIRVNIEGIRESDDVTMGETNPETGDVVVWFVVREGNVVAVIAQEPLEGVACRGSGIGGA